MSGCQLYRPTALSNYTDFYAGIHHAIAAGALLTPEDPLPPNYKWVPIAYHGRASSVQVSGATVRRPRGQRPPKSRGEEPGFGPSERLDLELEMGFYVGTGNPQGTSIQIGSASEQIVGFSLLNDWSSRDTQRWEMFPLGPFLSKSFATTVSPWVVTAEALIPFRVPALARSAGDPKPLSYLYDSEDQVSGGLDIALRVLLSSAKMRAEGDDAVEIITSNARHLYWTPAQMVAHHTVNGCNLLPGDLIGTGTISGPTNAELGSMLELTVGGRSRLSFRMANAVPSCLTGTKSLCKGDAKERGSPPLGSEHALRRLSRVRNGKYTGSSQPAEVPKTDSEAPSAKFWRRLPPKLHRAFDQESHLGTSSKHQARHALDQAVKMVLRQVLRRGVTSTPRSSGLTVSSGFFFAFMMFGSVT
ncbi:fumarylacetoacetate hydrolase family protein [Cupriavidus sp. D39]|uniref:fumarylacetoacetate hydrolase family protein n=1 Tax=Cupriavidus sp. D39 TaxID=2997877 RepID=UPI0022703976|nr:fumarylacetoacetate hydrolase family protein [Cupriavidus sp. D39]MCY0854134.1 fumarylacetoacetate hydrolase family protein [Cupriavidus sp. D39]